MLQHAVLCTHRFVITFTVCAFFALFAFAQGAQASDQACLDDFTVSTQAHDNGVRVLVEYDHPIWGWVDAGSVDFLDGGHILLTIRGEETREITDLREALAAFAEQQEASPALGHQLAMRIQQSAGN